MFFPFRQSSEKSLNRRIIELFLNLWIVESIDCRIYRLSNRLESLNRHWIILNLQSVQLSGSFESLAFFWIILNLQSVQLSSSFESLRLEKSSVWMKIMYIACKSCRISRIKPPFWTNSVWFVIKKIAQIFFFKTPEFWIKKLDLKKTCDKIILVCRFWMDCCLQMSHLKSGWKSVFITKRF